MHFLAVGLSITRFLRASHSQNRHRHSQYHQENAKHFPDVGLSPYQNRICQLCLQAAKLTVLDFGTAQC